LSESIVTERLELRPLVADDAEHLVGLLEDPVMREWLRSEDVSGLRVRFAAWERRESPDGRRAWLNWIVRRREDRVATGWVQATVDGDRAEVAYATLPSQRRQGYTAEAVAAVVERLGGRVVEAHIAAENLGSAGVANAVGLHPTDELDDGEVVWVCKLHACHAKCRPRPAGARPTSRCDEAPPSRTLLQ
jgi:RimJ/RimL family protein N-acetyltransferase